MLTRLTNGVGSCLTRLVGLKSHHAMARGLIAEWQNLVNKVRNVKRD